MVFEQLIPELQKIVQKRFREPTLPQKMAIPPILSGLNVLLIAETGTGKTESAMLPVFNFLMRDKLKPISALYITPLRSLNRDLLDRLIWWGDQTGLEISVRHGDTSQYERKLQLEFPPDLLISTLETLQPILTAKKFREHLRNVEYVILDEVHEIADSKRGVQLTIALERLKELCGDFQLIMLSATVGEPEKVADFFSGGKVVNIVEADTTKRMEIKVISPKPKSEDTKIAKKIFSSAETAARLRTIMEMIKGSRSALTFTNTREFAEILSSRIKTIDKKFPIAVHHSSLSKEVRIEAEKSFKGEKLKSLIATSSLQLGIDIGSVDLVLQYMSPRQVSQLIQRVGRSGHDMQKTSRGIIIATEEDDIFESAVIARKALAGELEEINIHESALDVLGHQIVGLTFDFGRVGLEKAYELVKRSHAYKDLSYSEFLEVCKLLDRIGLVFLNGYIGKKRRGFEYYFTHLSTIPDVKQYGVLNTFDNSFVGVLDEEFVALHGDVGTTFILKGEPYRIVSVEENKVLVEPTEDIEAAIPGWEGELIPVTFEIAQEVGRVRKLILDKLSNESESKIVSEIRKSYPIDENCARNMISVVKKQKKFGVVPDDRTILVEEFENLIVMHTCFGTNVNETVGRFITTLLANRVGAVAMKTDPYRIMIQTQQKIPVDLVKEILLTVKPEHFRSYLELGISKSELFEWKFVHVAKRLGAIARNAEYGKFTLKKIIQDYAGSPIYKETLKELETEKLDPKRSEEILRKIQSKEISLIFKTGLSPIGKIGIKHKYAEIVAPEKPEKEIFELFKQRLMNTKMRLACINCGDWDQTYTPENLPDNLKCKKCEAKLLAVAKGDWQIGKIVRKGLRKSSLTIEERKKFERLNDRANLFLTYGKKSVVVLAGRGVGPTTAKRILTKFHKDDNDLLRDILHAERQFLKTKKYWKV